MRTYKKEDSKKTGLIECTRNSFNHSCSRESARVPGNYICQYISSPMRSSQRFYFISCDRSREEATTRVTPCHTGKPRHVVVWLLSCNGSFRDCKCNARRISLRDIATLVDELPLDISMSLGVIQSRNKCTPLLFIASQKYVKSPGQNAITYIGKAHKHTYPLTNYIALLF